MTLWGWNKLVQEVPNLVRLWQQRKFATARLCHCKRCKAFLIISLWTLTWVTNNCVDWDIIFTLLKLLFELAFVWLPRVHTSKPFSFALSRNLSCMDILNLFLVLLSQLLSIRIWYISISTLSDFLKDAAVTSSSYRCKSSWWKRGYRYFCVLLIPTYNFFYLYQAIYIVALKPHEYSFYISALQKLCQEYMRFEGLARYLLEILRWLVSSRVFDASSWIVPISCFRICNQTLVRCHYLL